MEIALLVSAISQWILIALLGSLCLAIMKMIGQLTMSSNESSVSLKGVNIANAKAFDALSNAVIPISDLLEEEPLLVILTDPTCPSCLDKTERTLHSLNVPRTRTVLVVRGSDDATRLLGTQIQGLRAVLHEVTALGLSPLKAPYAAVVDRTGLYTGGMAIEEDSPDRPVRLWEAARDHQAMLSELTATQSV